MNFGNFVQILKFLKTMKKSTSELFVSFCYGTTTEIYEVYTTRKEAEKVNDLNNDNHEKLLGRMGTIVTNNPLKRPYKVLTLSDAMDKLSDYYKEYGEESMRCQITGDETISY